MRSMLNTRIVYARERGRRQWGEKTRAQRWTRRSMQITSANPPPSPPLPRRGCPRVRPSTRPEGRATPFLNSQLRWQPTRRPFNFPDDPAGLLARRCKPLSMCRAVSYGSGSKGERGGRVPGEPRGHRLRVTLGGLRIIFSISPRVSRGWSVVKGSK